MTGERFDPRPARSRASLLDAATALLRSGGPSAVTIDVVTKSANVALQLCAIVDQRAHSAGDGVLGGVVPGAGDDDVVRRGVDVRERRKVPGEVEQHLELSSGVPRPR
jgi:hypothetical protein